MQIIRTFVLAAVVLIATLVPAQAQWAYVADYDDRTVTVLDAATLLPVGPPNPIPILPPVGPDCLLGGNPDGVQFTRDRSKAFVSIDNCDQIAVIDTATRTVTSYIDALPGNTETRIFRRPRGRQRMYTTTCGLPHIAVIDVRTHAMIDVIDLPDGGTYPMAFSPDGRVGYAGNGFEINCGSPKGIYRLDLRDNVVSGFIATTRDVTQVAVHPGGEAALTTGADDRILVVDLKANTQAGAVMCGVVECVYGNTFGVTFNADGSRAYVIDFLPVPNEVITLDTTDPLNPKELSRTAIAGSGVGNTAFQVAIAQNRLYVLLWDLPTKIVVFDISTDPPVQLPGVGSAGNGGFEFDVSLCGTRGHDSLHPDNGSHNGHCKPPNNGSGHGRKKGHNQ